MRLKKNILLGAVLIVSTTFFEFISLKEFTPPGTVRITGNYFADEAEVENLAWREYEYWTLKKYGANSPQHFATIPDTAVWLDKYYYNAPYASYYYRHKAYEHYPVVGVTYEQVQAFCAWRSDRVKDGYLRRYKKPIALTYRLPSKLEWEQLAAPDSLMQKRGGRTLRGEIGLNCVREEDTTVNAEDVDVTAPVYSYWKNDMGLWQCLGNVAEMVAEKNISKGGSWRHRISECSVSNNIPYTGPTSWLGFRCVCVVSQ